MMKLLVAPHAVPTLIAMTDAGLALRMLGGVSYLGSFENMAKVEAAIGLPGDPVRRLGALGVMVAEDAERLWQKLRLTNAEHERLASMAEGWRRISPSFGEPASRALLYRLKPEQFTDHALLGWARSQASANDETWHALATLARALERAGVSVEGGGFHRARRREGPGARRGAGGGGESLDRGGVSARQSGARCDRRQPRRANEKPRARCPGLCNRRSKLASELVAKPGSERAFGFLEVDGDRSNTAAGRLSAKIVVTVLKTNDPIICQGIFGTAANCPAGAR